MVDRKGSVEGKVSFGRSTIAAPRATSRRSTRFTTRSSSRALQSSRAPIVIELGSTVIRADTADQFHPRHLILVPEQNKASSTHHNLNESQWYVALNPWIEAVYDRLLINPTHRKVVVVHPQHIVPKAWQAALEQIFWNKGVMAVTFVSALEVLPVAQGWKRGLIVHVSKEEAVCICHADGHLLPFTFQSVPECGYQHLLEDPEKLQSAWTPKLDSLLLDELHNPNSLVSALLKCLEACPLDIRYEAINNMLFCGDGLIVLPALGRRVAKRLEQILEGTQATLTPLPQTGDESVEGVTVATTHMTLVPTAVQSLKPLVSRLRVVSCAPHRPDMISWTASSLWAGVRGRYEDITSSIHWKTPPQEK